MMLLLRNLLALTLLLATVSASASRVVEAEGSATVRNGDIGRARVEARQNAARQVALQDYSHVQSTFSTGTGGLTDSAQLRSSAVIESMQVLSERLDGQVLTLTVRSVLGDGSGVCGEQASAYRKKIALVYVPVLRSRDVLVNDYHGYERGIPAELTRRLAATGDFLTRDAGDVGLYTNPIQAPVITEKTTDGRPLVTRLSEELGAQFVVSGVVHDLGVERTNHMLGRYFGAEPSVSGRRLEMEFFVHDALTGELLARHHFGRRAEGPAVIPPHSQAFGTRGFFASPFGQVFDLVLDEETQALRRLLRCRPTMMKVIQQRDGRLYLDAGADTGIERGDTLTLYRPDISGSVFGAEGSLSQFGHPKSTVRIIEVLPGYSVAEPDTAEGAVPFVKGELLRAW